MKLSQRIQPEAVLTGLEANDKWEALGKLLTRLVEVGLVPSESQKSVKDSIVAREKSMSTGMESGIAIPHAAVDGVSDLAISLGILPAGVPFDSIDGQPASIVILLVIPRSKKLTHIRTLAEVARLLSREGLRKKVLAAEDATAVLAAIKEEEAREPVNG